MLDERGYEAAALHGDVPQGQREKILARFRNKKTRILVATDVAARGIDISGLSHVVNYSLPFDAATYVHRIGRTGRAGTSGIAVTFVRPEERRKLGFLSKNIKKATKSDFEEGKIPEIKEVLAVKNERVIAELKDKLFKPVVECSRSECIETTAKTQPKSKVVSISPSDNSTTVSPVAFAAGGISYCYLMEALSLLGLKDIPVLKIGTPYPFPKPLAEEFLKSHEQIVVFEELDPVIEENLIKIAGLARVEQEDAGVRRPHRRRNAL